MRKKDLLLAIDNGTQSLKALIFDLGSGERDGHDYMHKCQEK